MKTCISCAAAKPETEFHRHGKSRGGLRARCKTCIRDENKARYRADRENVLARQRAYNKLPHVRARDKAAKAVYYRGNQERIKLRTRQWALDNPEAHAARRAADYAAAVAKLHALKDAPCVDCGGRFPPCAMDFDHVRGAKSYTIGASAMRRKSLPAELAKCELRCANCHRIRHHGGVGFALREMRRCR